MAKRPTTTRGASKKGAPGLEVILEAGEFSLGRIFRGVGNLLDLALRLRAEGKEEYHEERVFRGKTSTGKDVQAVLGFSVRTAAGLAKGAGGARREGAKTVKEEKKKEGGEGNTT